MVRVGSFFFPTISTVGGGIYLHFLLWCSDEEEQQFFEKGWDFNILELAYLLYKQLVQRLTRGLQQIQAAIIVLII
jgi:hypothetical protein